MAAIAVLLGLVAGMVPPVSGESFDEYRVKAVFLYNLAQFVEWPTSAFESTDQDFTIGILGPDPFGGEMARVVGNETIHGREINVIRYDDITDLSHRPCQMLFVNLSEKALMSTLYEKLAGTSVLTVSDHDGFAHQGGMINLYTAGSRIQLEINLDNTRRAGLQVSAKLLNLARLIGSTR
jgi:hypothetical protein